MIPSRSIKFRFWCKGTSNNPNFDKPGWWDWNNYILQKYHSLSGMFKDEDFIPCQYTGLKDKTDREIYEGDVVKTDNEHSSIIGCHWTEYDKGVVTWIRGGFNVCQANIGRNEIHHYVTCGCCPCGLEIIGNVFENPEFAIKI